MKQGMVSGAARCCAAAASIVAMAGAALAGTPAFYNLGFDMTASGLSRDGGVVVGTSGSQYFSWTPAGGAIGLGGAAGGGGQAQISDDGLRMVGTALNPASGFTEMSYRDLGGGGWQYLGSLGASSGDSASSGWGISGDGRTVVGLGWINPGSAHAVKWTQGGSIVDMGSTVMGASSRANAANGDGRVIVGWQDDEFGFRQGAVWKDGVQMLLTGPDGFGLGEAGDVTPDGNWVVGQGGYRWSEATGGEYLGQLPGGFFPQLGATGISDDGRIIVGYQREFGPPTFGEGFIWIEGQGMVNLTDWVQTQGVVLPAGTALSLPLAISGDGMTICGLGRDSTSFAMGWVVTVPSPGAGMLLGMAGLMAARRRR